MKFNFFQLADDCLGQWIESSAKNLSLERSRVLIQEGEPSENIYVLRRGKLTVKTSTQAGEEVLIAQLVDEGALVGEMSFLESRPPVASVTAEPGSEILFVSKEKLDKAINCDLALGRAFYHLMAQKLSQQIKGQNAMIHSSPRNPVEPLRKVLTLFGDLAESDVAWFSTNGSLYRLKPGEQLIRQGALLPDVYLILAGEASVSILIDGEDKIIGKSTRGEMLGEMSMVNSDDKSATANVRTTDGMEVVGIGKTVLQENIISNIGFGMRFYRGMARMLSQRSRDQLASVGMAFGSQQKELQSNQDGSDLDDEIDFEMMSSITTAGTRFDWLCKQFQNRTAKKVLGQS